MALSDRKLTIVITARQVVIALAVGAIVILCVAGFYVRRTLVAAKENQRKRYLKSFRILLHEFADLKDNSALHSNSSKFLRYAEALRTLRNASFDNDVIAFSFSVVDCNDVGPMAQIRYVDELIKVNQVNYARSSDDANTSGQLFLAPEYMPHPHLRMYGITELLMPLRVDESLSNNDAPYSRLEDGVDYLMVPEMMFNGITALEGQFILLDKSGNILDRFLLKELSGRGLEPSAPDANSLP